MPKNSKLAKIEVDRQTKLFFQTIDNKPQLRLRFSSATFSDDFSVGVITMPLLHATVLWICEEFQLCKYFEIIFVKQKDDETNITKTQPEEDEENDQSSFLSVIINYVCDNQEIVKKMMLPTSIHQFENFKLPSDHPLVLISEKRLIISGLSSVLRFVVKFVHMKIKFQILDNVSDLKLEKIAEKLQKLFGHKGCCLSSVSEVSIWTKFCEIDIFNGLSQAMKNAKQSNLDTNQIISEELVRFENHLRKPVKMHNIGKEVHIRKKTDISPIKHDHAEGSTMYLSDLVLFLPIHVFKLLYGDEAFFLNLPNVSCWYSNMSKVFPLNESNKLQFPPTIQHRTYDNGIFVLPNVPEGSLYNRDHERHNPSNRGFTRPTVVEEALKSWAGKDIPSFSTSDVSTFLNWEEIPSLVQPEGGNLPVKRREKKCQQLSGMAMEVVKVVEDMAKQKIFSSPLRIVDFCSGGGHLGILLAWLLPKCQIILVENKEESLRRAWERLERLGLTNVLLYQCNLDYFDSQFHVGTALHACGTASDLVLRKCISSIASFVCCPCCYGAIRSNHILQYPRSRLFLASGISLKHYFILAHASDQTHDEKHLKTQQGKFCMRLIDTDRLVKARESGYQVILKKIFPETASPKNHILVGVPSCNFTNNLSTEISSVN